MEFPLIEKELEQLDDQIKEAEKDLCWNGEGVFDKLIVYCKAVTKDTSIQLFHCLSQRNYNYCIDVNNYSLIKFTK